MTFTFHILRLASSCLRRCILAWSPNLALLLAVDFADHWSSGSCPQIYFWFCSPLESFCFKSHKFSVFLQVAPALNDLIADKREAHFCRSEASARH